jgi:hypothetical protein
MEVVESPEKSVAPWFEADGLLETVAAERVKAWWERAQRVYPANTQKAWRCDWAVFLKFCDRPSGREPRQSVRRRSRSARDQGPL